MQTDWSAVGNQTGTGTWYVVAIALPLLFVALLAFFVLRALARQRRYRAVSLLERRVVILADDGIDATVDAEFWADTDDAILDGIRRGSLRDGLIAGIRRAGDLLSARFPWRQGDRNEITDRLIVRRQ